MANVNILGVSAITDKNLKSTITSLEYETPEVTYYTTATATTNPSTDPVALLTYNVVYPTDRPHEIKLEAIVKLLSNISGVQTFTFDLYDTVDDATPISLGAVSIPDALNTAIAVKVNAVIRTSNTSATQVIEYGDITLYSLDGGAVTSVTLPTPVVETAEDAIRNFQLQVTASVGTATTTVQLLSAKVTLDRQLWG